MLKYNKFSLFILLLLPSLLKSQNCAYQIAGLVTDLETKEALEAVNVYLEGERQSTITDADGSFKISSICKGEYHLYFSHIGCEPQKLFLTVRQDTFIEVQLDHSDHLLQEIVLKESPKQATTKSRAVVNAQAINDNASNSLADMVQSIAGVSSLKNGSGIAKPVVQGLYGNRLQILNNGVAQSGQQWGNDHSPEIDPLTANRIEVVKGVAALQYMGANLGSVILVEPSPIEDEPHLHGKVNYFFESNGLSNGLNVQLQKSTDVLAWKLNGTAKRSGDQRAANYLLNNTGSQELNLALQLEKTWNESLRSSLYASTFNAELGVLRGAQIGNLTDLESAFSREIPFFTEEDFSYAIDAPKQQVNHHLLKLKTTYFIEDNALVKMVLAMQINKRKEFDVRRSGRSDIPTLSLDQYSYFGEAVYEISYESGLNMSTGLQFNVVDNTNVPETGILPLIPDYLGFDGGAFVRFSKETGKWFWEGGLRLENKVQNVAAISNSAPREIVRYNNTFQNVASSIGIWFRPTDSFGVAWNTGFATRNPAVNELYSQGLHQGVSGIEEGSPDLQLEKSIKTTLGVNANLNSRLFLDGNIYYQRFADYIFLEPQDEFRLTIRGAFPVFQYQQTGAEIFGTDIAVSFKATEGLQTQIKYSFLRGNDLENDIPLINMPANNLYGELQYELAKTIKYGGLILENMSFSASGSYVFRQGHLLASQDFTLPPGGYFLLGTEISSNLKIKNLSSRVNFRVENLLNAAYRDYLNQQRYFADDLGVNFSIGLSVDI